MIAKSYITIGLTQPQFIKLLADASAIGDDPDHPLWWLVHALEKAASEDDLRNARDEIKRQHKIMHLGNVVPRAAS